MLAALTHHARYAGTDPPHPPSYVGFGVSALVTVLILYGKPDTSIKAWAKPHAVAELEEEDAIFAKYASDAAYRAQVRGCWSGV